LQRVEREGARAVAAELGVSTSTLRTWRKRLADGGALAESVPLASGVALDDGALPGADADPVEALRRQLVEARRHAAAAGRRYETLAATGEAVRAREEAISAKSWTLTARSVEASLADAEREGLRLDQARDKLLVTVLERFCEAVGVPFDTGGAVRKLLAELLRQAGRGEPLRAPAALVGEARAAVLAVLARQLTPAGESSAPAPLAAPAMPDLGSDAPLEEDELDDDDDEPEGSPVDEAPIDVGEPDLDAEAAALGLSEEERARLAGLRPELAEDVLQRRREAARESEEVEAVWAQADPMEQAGYLAQHVTLAVAQRAYAQDRREGRTSLLSGVAPSLGNTIRSLHPSLGGRGGPA